MQVKSLEELMSDTVRAALRIAYETISPEGHYLTARDLPEDVADRVFGWVDGLEHKYLESRMAGRCSLAAFITIDISEYEVHVIEDMTFFESYVVSDVRVVANG